MDGGTVTRDQPVTVYTEKSLEMAAEHPLYFAAWLVLEAAHGAVLALEDKVSARLQDCDRTRRHGHGGRDVHAGRQ